MLANTTYGGLSGTNVFWDFVELPSQIMENWCYEKQALELFARHYQTDEHIPMEFIEKIKKLTHFQQGLQTLRQLGFGFLDLSYHSKDATTIKDVKGHESAIQKGCSLLQIIQRIVLVPDFPIYSRGLFRWY